jgi:hypothetical protein
MTVFAQFAVPETEGRMACLFVDPGQELDGQPESGTNAVVVQPGAAAEPHIRLETGPTYVSTESVTRRFVPRMRFPFVERRALAHEGLDPADWADLAVEGSTTSADTDSGGSPLWLQGPEWPQCEGWRFLFQFNADYVGHEFGDTAECFGFISDDGRGAFLWQCR